MHFAENLNYSRQWPFPRGMPALLWGTMQMGLAAFRAQAAMPFEEAVPELKSRFFTCVESDDAKEGMAAFFEKRPPVWKD